MNMKSKINNLLKLSAIFCVIIFLVLKYLKGSETLLDNWELITQAVGYSVILTLVYEKWIWRINPLIKIPKFKKEYGGLIKYEYNGIQGTKNIDIKISQTLTNVYVSIKSDEITSKSITSELVEENNKYVLYYTYITQPKSEFSDENPIQYGTCKVLVDDVKEFHGIYWTTSKTKGDIYFVENKKDSQAIFYRSTSFPK